MIVELINATDVNKCGGKAVNLQKLMSYGFTVPSGFVLSTDSRAEMTEELKSNIIRFFKKLDSEYVAVRSSAVVEDGNNDSWAGQLETYLNVTKATLIKAVEDCWLSARSERATAYAERTGSQLQPKNVAVIIQSMVDSDVSGVAFSYHPVTKTDQVVVEAGYGLGEAIVSGSITPDNYIIDKSSGVIEKYISSQDKMLLRVDGNNDWKNVEEPKRSSQKMSDEKISRLVEDVIKIEKCYGKPMDIEWAFKDKELYITQARPITTLR